jgi:uncharacterized protein DUF5335
MASETQELPRETWTSYFDEFSKHLGTLEATVEVAGSDLGDQISAERLVLTGITFDYKDDVLVIGLDAPGGDPEEYEHMVEHPQRIFIATGEGAELTVDVEDADGHRTLVTLDRPPALPAPG